MKERITRLIQRWFIQEPALFQVLCSHEIAENTKMSCPVRSGKGRAEGFRVLGVTQMHCLPEA